MSFFFASIIVRLKLMLTPSFIAVLMIFPVALFTAGIVSSHENAGKIRVGMVYPPSSEKVVADFKSYVSNDAEIIAYEDAESAKRDVSSWKIECAYVILEDQKTQLYKSPQTMSADVLNIMLAASFMRNISGDLGYNAVKDLFPKKTKDEITRDIKDRTAEFLTSGPAMKVNFKIDGKIADSIPASSTANGVYHGLVALFALLISLVTSMTMANEKSLGKYKALISSGVSIFRYYIYNGAAVFMLIMLFMCVSTATFSQVPFFNCLFYSLACSAICILLAILLPSGTLFPALISLVFILSALLGSVVFDVGELFKQLEPAKYLFITTYYVEGLSASMQNCLALLGISSCALSVTALKSYRRVV